MRLAFSFKVLMFWKPIQKRKKLKDLHTVLDKMLAFTFYEAATMMFRRKLAGNVLTKPLPSGRSPVVDSSFYCCCP
jgi:hypothetical protein